MPKTSFHINISERKILLRVVDLLSIFLVLYGVSFEYSFDYFSISKENWQWVFVLGLYLLLFGAVFEIYDLKKASKFETIFTGLILTVSTTVLFYLLTPFLTPELPQNRLQIVFFYLSILIALSIWRFIYIVFIVSPRFRINVLIIGETLHIDTIIKEFNSVDPNYNIIGFVDCTGGVDAKISTQGLVEYSKNELIQVVKNNNVSEIIVACHHTSSITSEVYQDLISLLERGFSIREYTQVFEEKMFRIPVEFVDRDFYKYFPFSESQSNRLFLLFQWFFGMLISLVGVAVGLLLLPLIFIGNLIANPGPLFYTQIRVGKNGRPFKIIKFRTMVENAEANGAVWAIKNDVRVTFFGKIMRNTRIDEIPQFINVLKGDMNFIGPRPERPQFVSHLSRALPFYETRHIIKPGLTGWAQVKTRYASSVDDSLLKLQYDLYYIKHRSFFLDVNIFIKTLTSVLFFRGQ